MVGSDPNVHGYAYQRVVRSTWTDIPEYDGIEVLRSETTALKDLLRDRLGRRDRAKLCKQVLFHKRREFCCILNPS